MKDIFTFIENNPFWTFFVIVITFTFIDGMVTHFKRDKGK